MTKFSEDDWYETFEHIESESLRDYYLAKRYGTPATVLDTIARKPVDDRPCDCGTDDCCGYCDVAERNNGLARMWVADNRGAAPKTLQWLGMHIWDVEMIQNLVRNSSTPQPTLRKFARSTRHLHFDAFLVQNEGPDTTVAMRVVEKNPDESILTLALENPAIQGADRERVQQLMDQQMEGAL